MMWALDPEVEMPSEDDLMKMPVEHEPKSKKEEEDGVADDPDAEKMFPFMLRIIPKNITTPIILQLK
jgi:hypothetical protein